MQEAGFEGSIGPFKFLKLAVARWCKKSPSHKEEAGRFGGTSN